MYNYNKIATPALLVDKEILDKNILSAQKIADSNGVMLRPHVKTHKSAFIAKMQIESGACGIAVAKVAEAEIMAEHGIKDIFIANEPVGADKIQRIRKLADTGIKITFGIDCIEHAKMADSIFQSTSSFAEVLIEVEVGENRSGVVNEGDFIELLRYIKNCKKIKLMGLFSHDGNSYKAKTRQEAKQIGVKAQKKTLEFKNLMAKEGFSSQIVSIGSTTSIMLGCEILSGITEIRIGTYTYMDASQSKALGNDSHSSCAATVLLSIMSKPTKERLVLDGGAKSLTMQKRDIGITSNAGYGKLKHYDAYIMRMYDEHSILEDDTLNEQVRIGDKVEIIPNHICPVVNLFKKFYLVECGKVLAEYPVSCAQATE